MTLGGVFGLFFCPGGLPLLVEEEEIVGLLLGGESFFSSSLRVIP